jgi:hypothetical protein
MRWCRKVFINLARRLLAWLLSMVAAVESLTLDCESRETRRAFEAGKPQRAKFTEVKVSLREYRRFVRRKLDSGRPQRPKPRPVKGNLKESHRYKRWMFGHDG